MDLALHLGMTVGGLKRGMTEREFIAWRAYTRRRMLPWRRMEMMLAQLSVQIARTMGGSTTATLSDYLFDPKDDEAVDAVDADADDDELTAEDVAAFFHASLVRAKD